MKKISYVFLTLLLTICLLPTNSIFADDDNFDIVNDIENDIPLLKSANLQTNLINLDDTKIGSLPFVNNKLYYTRLLELLNRSSYNQIVVSTNGYWIYGDSNFGLTINLDTDNKISSIKFTNGIRLNRSGNTITSEAIANGTIQFATTNDYNLVYLNYNSNIVVDNALININDYLNILNNENNLINNNYYYVGLICLLFIFLSIQFKGDTY